MQPVTVSPRPRQKYRLEAARKDQLAALQDIRVGDLPVPLYELFAELLAQFAEGTLYDAAADSQEALGMFEELLHKALATAMLSRRGH
jgi:hypothetical protein